MPGESSYSSDESGSPNAAGRYFAVMELVAGSSHPLTAAEISTALTLPKPTAYRLIDALDKMGFISRQSGSRRIVPGQRLIEFAFNVLRASSQCRPRQFILETLVREVGETCNIGTIDRCDIVYLNRVEADHWPLRLQFDIGSRVPLHCSAIGKLFLASFSDEQRRELFDQVTLTRFTPNTIVDRAALETELETIRREGLSIDREEYIAGVICVAAPIRNKNGKLLAGIAMQAPSARMSEEQALKHRQALVQAAEQLSASFEGKHAIS